MAALTSLQSIEELFLALAVVEGVSRRERDVLETVKGYLAALGLEPYEDSSATHHDGACGNLLCPVQGGGDTLMVAHMDTIASTAGLKPQLLDDRITSDGTTILGADNRAGIAALLFATKSLLESGRRGPGFTLAFTVREELDSLGAIHLEIPEGIENAFVFDSHLRSGGFIQQGYGAKRFKVIVEGRTAHAGLYPERGINAIAVAGVALGNLRWGRLDEETTANVGIIGGGERINVVPDRCIVEGEVRSLSESAVERTLHRIEMAFEGAANDAGATITLESRWDFKPYRHSRDTVLYKRCFRLLQAAGLQPEAHTSAGGSDANELNARGLPTVNLGIGAQEPHSREEFILLTDLEADVKIALTLMRGDL